MTTRVRAAWLLAAAFLVAHLPFLPGTLEDLDSINFALGLRTFDVAQHQPHPPGYPVFIALGKVARMLVPSEAVALGLVSVLAGSLAVVAMARLFETVSRRESTARVPWIGALIAVTAPLYWLTAVRPLSDMAGLAATLLAQGLTLRAVTEPSLAVAAAVAGAAVGVRSQVVWLTAPLLLLVLWRWPRATRVRAVAMVAAGYGLGVMAWALPLLAWSGGVSGYVRALGTQGAEDFAGVAMLATHPSPRLLVEALAATFVTPWGEWWVAGLVIAAALAGAVRIRRTSVDVTALAIAFGPYALFHLLFQETVTTRYALPLVLPMAFLAGVGLAALPRSARWGSTALVAVASLAVGGAAVRAYSRAPAPAFQVLHDMGAAAVGPQARPVLAMHRRQELDMRRPLLWEGERVPSWSAHLGAPPKHEWLELVKYWNGGGQAPVWFLADPPRSDLRLVDSRSLVLRGAYRWSFPTTGLIGGIRPNVMDWYEIVQPNWYLGGGWALTPETAGVASDEHLGPGYAPILGWIRRRSGPATLMIGGRNFAANGAGASLTVAVDGHSILETTVAPGFFLRFVTVPAGTLAGAGDMAALSVSASAPDVAIEQFDLQSAGEVVYGFADGWQEQEYNPRTGRLWRWTSDRATLRVVAPRRPLTLSLAGEFETGAQAARVIVRAGDRVLAEREVPSPFTWDVAIPADAILDGAESVLTIETSEWYVPAETNWRPSQDRRRLGLRLYGCDLRPAS